MPPAYESRRGSAAVPAAPAAEISAGRNSSRIRSCSDLHRRARLLNNRDLRIATLNVEAARAQYRIQRAELVPSIDAAGLGHQPAHAGVGCRTPGESELTRTYSRGLRRCRPSSSICSAACAACATRRSRTTSRLEENRTAAQLLLVSEVANAWLTLIADRELLRAGATKRATASSKSYDLTKLRFDSGVSSEIDLHRSETAWREAEVDIAQQTRRVAQDRNALALLVGEPLPPEIGGGAQAVDAQTFCEGTAGRPAGRTAGAPARRARRRARAARRPTPTSARRARRSSRASSSPASTAMPATICRRCSSPVTRSWSFVPQVRLPIFSGGANMAGLDLANVRKRIEIARYEQSIQVAFREVADALVARSTLEDQLRAQEALTRAAEASYRLADMRYRGGVDSYLGALIAQRDMYDAQRALIVTRLAGAVNLVQLYQALGGGWKE